MSKIWFKAYRSYWDFYGIDKIWDEPNEEAQFWAELPLECGCDYYPDDPLPKGWHSWNGTQLSQNLMYKPIDADNYDNLITEEEYNKLSGKEQLNYTAVNVYDVYHEGKVVDHEYED